MTTAVASNTAERQQRKRELEEHFAADFSTLAYPLLADVYYQAGDLVRARKVCRIGLKYHPGHPPGLYLLALVNMREGQMEAAEDLLDRTLAQDPYHVEAAEYLVAIQERLKRPPGVLERAYKILLHANPLSHSAQVRLKRMQAEKELVQKVKREMRLREQETAREADQPDRPKRAGRLRPLPEIVKGPVLPDEFATEVSPEPAPFIGTARIPDDLPPSPFSDLDVKREEQLRARLEESEMLSDAERAWERHIKDVATELAGGREPQEVTEEPEVSQFPLEEFGADAPEATVESAVTDESVVEIPEPETEATADTEPIERSAAKDPVAEKAATDDGLVAGPDEPESALSAIQEALAETSEESEPETTASDDELTAGPDEPEPTLSAIQEALTETTEESEPETAASDDELTAGPDEPEPTLTAIQEALAETTEESEPEAAAPDDDLAAGLKELETALTAGEGMPSETVEETVAEIKAEDSAEEAPESLWPGEEADEDLDLEAWPGEKSKVEAPAGESAPAEDVSLAKTDDQETIATAAEEAPSETVEETVAEAKAEDSAEEAPEPLWPGEEADEDLDLEAWPGEKSKVEAPAGESAPAEDVPLAETDDQETIVAATEEAPSETVEETVAEVKAEDSAEAAPESLWPGEEADEDLDLEDWPGEKSKVEAPAGESAPAEDVPLAEADDQEATAATTDEAPSEAVEEPEADVKTEDRAEAAPEPLWPGEEADEDLDLEDWPGEKSKVETPAGESAPAEDVPLAKADEQETTAATADEAPSETVEETVTKVKAKESAEAAPEELEAADTSSSADDIVEIIPDEFEDVPRKAEPVADEEDAWTSYLTPEKVLEGGIEIEDVYSITGVETSSISTELDELEAMLAGEPVAIEQDAAAELESTDLEDEPGAVPPELSISARLAQMREELTAKDALEDASPADAPSQAEPESKSEDTAPPPAEPEPVKIVVEDAPDLEIEPAEPAADEDPIMEIVDEVAAEFSKPSGIVDDDTDDFDKESAPDDTGLMMDAGADDGETAGETEPAPGEPAEVDEPTAIDAADQETDTGVAAAEIDVDTEPLPPRPPKETDLPFVDPQLATFTLADIYRVQGLYQQALQVLEILEEKDGDPDRIERERVAITAAMSSGTKSGDIPE